MKEFTSADMIRLSGHYTVARMLERDDFQKRLANNLPISMHEIFYKNNGVNISGATSGNYTVARARLGQERILSVELRCRGP